MREGRGKETEEEKGSRGRAGKQGCRGGGRESRQQSTRLKDLGKQRRREAHQAEREVPDGGAGAAADGRWGRRLEAEQVLHGLLRGMGGRLVDSSRGAAKPQAELEVRPPPAIFLSPRPHSR